MEHGISEQQWLRFVDGDIAEVDRRRIQTHVNECAECARLADGLRSWNQALKTEGEQLRRALAMPEERLEVLLTGMIGRLQAARPEASRRGLAWTVGEGLSLLRFVLEPIAGSGATRATINLAMQRSVGADQCLTSGSWRLFVGNLREATTLICGMATGRLVGMAGMCLAIEG